MSRFSAFIKSSMWTLVTINTTERMILFAIFLNQFSYWPTKSFEGLGGFSLEVSMASGLVIFLQSLRLYRGSLFSKLLSLPYFLPIYLWMMYGVGLGMVMSSSPATILVKGLYLFSIILGANLVGVLYVDRRIEIENILKGWVGLAILMTPVFIGQYLLAVLGVDGVIRRAYQVSIFEFPRLHGFSHEPLFLANWLLVPAIYSIRKKGPQGIVATLITLMIFLTLARGAIYALVVGLLVYALVSRLSLGKIRDLFRPVTTALGGALLIVAISAQLNGSTPLQGAFRYMDHLTLGLFNSGGASNVGTIDVGDRTVIDTHQIDRTGVVEASTISRIEAIKLGFEIYGDRPITGVGMFRLGEEANLKYPEVYQDTSLVTNSQPVDVLAETGLIGLVIIALLVVLKRRQLFRRSVLSVLLFALFFQFLFFTALFIFSFWLILSLALVSRSERGLKIG